MTLVRISQCDVLKAVDGRYESWRSFNLHVENEHGLKFLRTEQDMLRQMDVFEVVDEKRASKFILKYCSE